MNFQNKLKRLRRAIQWAWFIWKNGEYQPLVGVEFTLEYLYERMVSKYGSDYKSLRVALRLLHRIDSDFYYDALNAPFVKKWGEYELTFVKCPDGLYTSNMAYPNAVTEEDNKLARQEMHDRMDRETAWRTRDLNLFYEIMKKHSHDWWY